MCSAPKGAADKCDPSLCANMREPSEYEAPLCASVGGDFWFPEKVAGGTNGTELQMVKSICRQCSHQTECAEWGIQKEDFGVWGGLSELDRRLIRRKKNIILKGDGVA